MASLDAAYLTWTCSSNDNTQTTTGGRKSIKNFNNKRSYMADISPNK